MINQGRQSAKGEMSHTISSIIFIIFSSMFLSLIIFVMSVIYFWPGFGERILGIYLYLAKNILSEGLNLNPLYGLLDTYIQRSQAPVKLPIILFVSAASAQVYYYFARGRTLFKKKYIKGSKLQNAQEFKQSVTDGLKKFREDFKRDTGWEIGSKKYWGSPLYLGVDRIAIPQMFLPRAMMVCGVPGTGKTQLISQGLERARKNNEKCFILDPNGEFYSKFGRPQDKILSLYDKRSERWEPHKESYGDKQFNIQKIADFLVQEGRAEDMVWWQGARIVLSYLLAQTENIDEMKALITNIDKGTLDQLDGLARTAIGKDTDSKQAAGVASQAMLGLQFLFDLNHWPDQNRKDKAFSVYEWAQNNDRSWVFVTYADDDKNIMSPLLKIWTNLAIFGVTARPESLDNIPCNIVIDEMGDVGTIEQLASALRRFRKYQGQLYFGLQSMAQFFALYPQHVAKDMLNIIGNKLYFRLSEVEETKRVSEDLGQASVKDPSQSQRLADGKMDNSISEGSSRKEFVVYPEEVKSLPDGYFYLKSMSFNPVKSRVRYKRFTKINALHIEEHCYPPRQVSANFRKFVERITNRAKDMAPVLDEVESLQPLSMNLPSNFHEQQVE